MQVLIAIILVILLIIYINKPMFKKKNKSKSIWTVYGSMNCGWTRKQLEHLDGKSVKYTFIDCDKNPGKCNGMEAFPTTIDNSSKEKHVGFKDL